MFTISLIPEIKPLMCVYGIYCAFFWITITLYSIEFEHDCLLKSCFLALLHITEFRKLNQLKHRKTLTRPIISFNGGRVKVHL